jgi:hypothetical protein
MRLRLCFGIHQRFGVYRADDKDNGGKYKNAIKQLLNSVNVDISELPQVSSAGE